MYPIQIKNVWNNVWPEVILIYDITFSSKMWLGFTFEALIDGKYILLLLLIRHLLIVDSARIIELDKSPRFHVRPAQYWLIRSDCKIEHSPHGLFALPADLHAWERTCHLNIVVMYYSPAIRTKFGAYQELKILHLYVIISSGEHFATIL